jgi:hypothetical protein
MSKTMLEQMCEATDDDPEFMARVLVKSMTDDVYIQINSLSAMVIKGQVYEEQEGRIVQLKALNDGKVEFGGATYRIESATVSKDHYRHYDFDLVKDDAGLDKVSVTLEYQAVRKMVERKKTVLDFVEDHDLLQRLNDMHADCFKINGKPFYIYGEQWTQSKPGHRDLILMPKGESHPSKKVIKAVPEKLIQQLIDTKAKSFLLEEDDGSHTPR